MLTRDPRFRSAVEALAGALGHTVRTVAALTAAGDAPLVVVDLASGADAVDLAGLDPLRAALFVPRSQPATDAAARAAALRTFPRGALVTELPQLIAERT